MDAIVLILSDARGQYIPRDFLTDDSNEIDFAHCAAWGLTKDNMQHWEDAANPESGFYWDAWEWVCDSAEFTDKDGSVYRLYQDGDLWGICEAKMTNEERENFGFDTVECSDDE